MHEDVQRRLVRIAFVVGCLLPTAFLLGVAAMRALPWEAVRLERHLRNQLGLDIQIEQVRHPRPRQLRLERVSVFDLESHEPIATISAVTATQTQRGWRLRLDTPALIAEQMPSLWRSLRYRILPLDLFSQQIADVSASQLELRVDGQPFTLYQFTWFPVADADNLSTIQFHRDPAPAQQPIRLRLQQDRTAVPVATRLTLETGSTPIPVTLLAAAAGVKCEWSGQFQGELPVLWTNGSWSGRLTGQFRDIALREVATGWLPYSVEGQAEVQVEQCEFDMRGLRSTRGHLHLASVTVDPRLLDSLMKDRSLMENNRLFAPGPAYVASSDGEPVALSCVDFDFSLTEFGLICRSAPDSAGLRVAAAGPNGPVLLCDGHLRVDWLIRALIPEETAEAYAIAARWQELLPPTLPRLESRR